MKKFLLAHYEKIILAVLLIVFTAMLYYQLMFIQRAQNQKVKVTVNPTEKPSDYEPVDFAADKKYKMETIFSEWNEVEPTEASATKTQLMTPYPMAECVYCHALIPANSYPAIGETRNGKCRACGKALAPRIKVEDDLAGKSDVNANGIPDDWEKEMNIDPNYVSAESDEDSDGFSLIQEFKAKTNPTDPLSHPKYITQVNVSAVSRTRFNGLELVSVDRTKPDKKDWQATFNVVRNGNKRSAFVQIGGSTFSSNNVSFSVIDIEMDEKTQEPIVYIQRVGKADERIVCRVKQPVYDPAPRVRLLNNLYSRTITTSVGAEFTLGTDKTGKEVYRVVSADPTSKEVVVESKAETPETFKLQPAPKESADTNTGSSAIPGAPPTTPTRKDDSPFLQRQR